MTALYIPIEGFKLNYSTPIMGFPWTVPMEFPIYQWLAVLLHKVFNFDLMVSGKLINIICHIINNIIIISVFKQQHLSEETAYTGLIFYNLFPFYLVYDTVFLVDGFSLTLSFITLYFLSLFLVHKKRALYGILFLLFASATGISKSTTFIGVLTPLIAVLLLKTLVENGGLSKLFSLQLPVVKKISTAGLLFVLAFAILYIWVDYSDKIKQLNPLSSNWTSTNLKAWNFGTLQQRLSLGNWKQWLSYSMVAHPLIYMISALVICTFFFFSNRKEKTLFLCFLIFMLSPLLIFFNLFFIHTYYGIANTIFLYFLLAIPLAVLLKQKARLIRLGAIAAGFMILLFGLYRTYAFRNQVMKTNTETGVFGQLYKIDFKPDINDVLVLIQPSRDPYLQYYFKCRGINLNKVEYEKYGRSDKLKKLSGNYPIKMICIVDEKPLNVLPHEYLGVMPEGLKQLSISHQPESSNYYNFFWY